LFDELADLVVAFDGDDAAAAGQAGAGAAVGDCP
jgi:hypothetical protein